MLQEAQVLGQLEPAQFAGQADEENDEIGAQPCAPCQRCSDGEGGEVLDRIHYMVAPTTQGANSSSPKPRSSDLDLLPEAVSSTRRKMRSPACSTVSLPSTTVPQLTSMSSSMRR